MVASAGAVESTLSWTCPLHHCVHLPSVVGQPTYQGGTFVKRLCWPTGCPKKVDVVRNIQDIYGMSVPRVGPL